MIETTVLKEIEDEISRDLPNIDIAKSLNILNNLLSSSLPDELKGISDRFSQAINTFFNKHTTGIDKERCITDALRIEAPLRLILYYTNRSEYCRISAEKQGFVHIIKALDLNPKNYNLNKDPYEYHKNKDYSEQLAQVYQVRNAESHTCLSWSNRDLYYNIDCVLIILIVTINKNMKLLENINASNNISKKYFYLESLINNFKDKMKKFIKLNGEENLSAANQFINEYIQNDPDENEEKPGRSGTIDELRTTKLPEKRMAIWGNAGVGKSTTMEYLVYLDAKKYLNDTTQNIPVFVPLGLLTDHSQTISQFIQNKIGVDSNELENLLCSGKINLFFDGLNEIPDNHNNTMKKNRLKEIQNYIDTYKNTLIIISNRPEDFSSLNNIPIFNILEMNIGQIKQFLSKNTSRQETVDLIYNEIMVNERLMRVVQTPLMLSRLIDIVDCTNEIPKSEGKIIGAFLDNLLKREIYEKKETMFDLSKATMLLMRIAFEGMNDTATNAGMTKNQVINYMNQCMTENNFKADPFYCIDIFCQLGILIKYDDQFVFAHQMYQEYYIARQMEELK